MKKNQNGYSLVELLIAITLSFVAMIAATEAYVSSRQTYRLQSMQSRLSEDGRFALFMLQRTIAQAGFRQSPLVALPSDRIAIAANVVTLKFESDGVNQIVCDGTIPNVGTSNTLVIQSTANKLQCATNAAASVDWIAPASAGAGNGTEVIDFQTTLGIDTGPISPSNFGCGPDTGTRPRDCIADKYEAALIVGETTDQIMSVRICLMLRTEMIDSSIDKPAAVKNCAGADIPNSQTDKKLYRMYTTTVMLKNR